MEGTANMKKTMIQIWRRIWDRATRSPLDEEVVERQLQEARKSLPVPVLWLLGKSQSGKTSLIRALTGSSSAEIGNGFRACTRSARMYDFPDSQEPFLRFLDTRGLGEVDYDPREDLQQFQNQANLLIVVVKAMDHAQQSVLDPLRTLLKANPKWPVIVLQTCLHEGYPTPSTPHAQPYSYDQFPFPPSVPFELARSLATQREWFCDDFGDADNVFQSGKKGKGRWWFVPVDFTLPEDGREPLYYGLESLWSAIEEAVPIGLREMLCQSPDVRQPLRDERYRTAQAHIWRYAVAAAGAGAVPLPLIDVPVLFAIQAKMFYTIARIYGQPMGPQRMAELSSTLGLTYLGRLGVRELLKFIPFAPIGVGAASLYAGSSTYALGSAMCGYFSRFHDGDVPDPSVLRDLYADEFKKAQNWFASRVASTTEEKN